MTANETKPPISPPISEVAPGIPIVSGKSITPNGSILAAGSPTLAPAQPSDTPLIRRFLPGRRSLRNRKVVVGVVILLFFALIALFAPLLAPGDPLELNDSPNLAPSSDHLLGTTDKGRMCFGRSWSGLAAH